MYSRTLDCLLKTRDEPESRENPAYLLASLWPKFLDCKSQVFLNLALTLREGVPKLENAGAKHTFFRISVIQEG